MLPLLYGLGLEGGDDRLLGEEEALKLHALGNHEVLHLEQVLEAGVDGGDLAPVLDVGDVDGVGAEEALPGLGPEDGDADVVMVGLLALLLQLLVEHPHQLLLVFFVPQLEVGVALSDQLHDVLVVLVVGQLPSEEEPELDRFISDLERNQDCALVEEHQRPVAQLLLLNNVEQADLLGLIVHAGLLPQGSEERGESVLQLQEPFPHQKLLHLVVGFLDQLLDHEAGLQDVLVVNVVLLHVFAILLDDDLVLADPLDGLDHVAFEAEVEGGESQLLEVIAKELVLLSGHLDRLVSVLVVVAVLGVYWLEVVPVEELGLKHSRQLGEVGVIVLHHPLQLLKEVAVQGQDLVYVAEKGLEEVLVLNQDC